MRSSVGRSPTHSGAVLMSSVKNLQNPSTEPCSYCQILWHPLLPFELSCSVCRHTVRSADVHGRSDSNQETSFGLQPCTHRRCSLDENTAVDKVRWAGECPCLSHLSLASSSCQCELFVPRRMPAPHKILSWHTEISMNNKPEDDCHTVRNTTSLHPRHFRKKKTYSHTKVPQMSTWPVAPTGLGLIVRLTQNESRHMYGQDIIIA